MVSLSPQTQLKVRSLHYRDLNTVNALLGNREMPTLLDVPAQGSATHPSLYQWSALLKVLGILPQQLSQFLRTYVLEQSEQVAGLIQVSPFNRTRSTWRVNQVCVADAIGYQTGGTMLVRHCLEHIWEARTWLAEVEINQNDHLGLYRHNGFQPLAQLTYWSLTPEKLTQLCAHEPVLPNLLPVNNADAGLLCQLDTASMPPLVRQVFDRHIQDFKSNLLAGLASALQSHLQRTEKIQGYVFEPQRKAAIGYFEVCLSRDGSCPHAAELTVHPAYTWLYPELLAHMAHLTQKVPPAPLYLTSADYQSEREQYLEDIGAERLQQTLLMSRSVWHKLRESRALSLDNLQLTGVLQGWQPNQTPIPGRMSWLKGGFGVDSSISSLPRKNAGLDRRSTDTSAPAEPPDHFSPDG